MFDVLVIGGGHAGVEAAAAAARRGARVGLVTFRADDIGQMSCNPSIGGVGKGHLVRELDIFDGLMARAADRAAIHRRMLNRSKGSAVHGPRVQADRSLYRQAVQRAVTASGVEQVIGEAIELLTESGRVSGVALADGTRIASRAVVIATGTFLDAELFCGMERIAGGRRGEQATIPLARQLRELGVAQGRLKTGTPPRLDGRTIDWSRLAPQPSDRDGWSMSAIPPEDRPPELACAIARTNMATHDIIAANLDRSPLFAGAIEGRGPRYCPSIEDKIKRFGDRDGHQIFLEPEGLATDLVYPNGISTSLPADVQQDFVNSIAGFEQCRIVRPGYAVEYEYADARQLRATLEHGALHGLFLAGQINGTTGYEEAAAQGLVAGLNAAAAALDLDPQRFDRRTSYIGVMIDDLTLQGVTEPYRMMTARAEHRLALRADNATTRLGRASLECNAVSVERRDQIAAHFAARETGGWAETEEGRADALYAPYIARQDREWAAVHRETTIVIPDQLDFRSVPGLSNEAVERLELARPETIDQASRVRGITPAALAALHVAVSRRAASDSASALAEYDVPRETLQRIEHFAALLTEENRRQNLVAKSTLPDLWQRHIADAAQLVAFAPTRGSWLDIGSGAGLPGVVVAILTGEPMLLVEPRRLRAEFLQRTVDALDLRTTVSVIQSRIEAVRHPPVDIITARAVASIDRLFAIAGHLSHNGTIWVLPKGRRAKSELDEARRTWQGEFRLEPSRTDPDAQILVASRVRRRSGARGVA